MIDIKFLRDNPDAVRASQKGRGEDVTIVDRVLAIDEIRRAALSEFETLRAEQNAHLNQLVPLRATKRRRSLKMQNH